MVLVLSLAAVLWGIGHFMGAPKSARGLMIGLLYVAVLALHLVLPDGHPLRLATGESAALWLILGGFVAIVLGYRQVLTRLRTRADTSRAETGGNDGPAPLFTETELNRYARHIVLREIGGPGQKRLKEAKVLVIGAGGLGAPALQYLAAAGVGTIGVVDDDAVENANLQRQVIHKDASIGMPKVFSAQAEMQAQNPFVQVRPYHRRLTEDIAAELFAEYDVVLDGTDNFQTRYLVNETAVAAGIPLISGALSQWEGQLSVFDPAQDAPCYRCIFDEAPAPELAPSCAEAGVIGPLPGVIGAMMAVEAVKLITGAGAPLRGQMLIYDALYGESRQIAVSRRAGCPVCGGS
ncbi:HesA/MoeB/ThiF family protein [Roseobacter sp. S98]|uniref:HesA/MoeB/ThiF family protein n=1 Tax=Roseobacter algicola (ex Choi et al. 2025) (nom. illeg.) TaxID=3092138 RepID=UPI0035C6D51F